MTKALAATLIALAVAPAPLTAQDTPREPRRTRVGIGPQLVPKYPGADKTSLRPLIEVSRARGLTEFEFEAADESFGFPVFRSKGFSAGPSLGFEGKRKSRDVGAVLPTVKATFEAGAFAQYALNRNVRLRLEGREGLGGHKGLSGVVSADYVTRRGDDHLFSIGPRVTLADGRYQRAYLIIAGTLAIHASSPGVERGFCAVCGTSLTYRRDNRPGLFDVTTGSLDTPEAFAPTKEIWLEQKLGWVASDETLPRYPQFSPPVAQS